MEPRRDPPERPYINSQVFLRKMDGSKKSPTVGPTERTPKPEYLIALPIYLGVRWDSVPFNFWWSGWMEMVISKHFLYKDVGIITKSFQQFIHRWPSGFRLLTRDVLGLIAPKMSTVCSMSGISTQIGLIPLQCTLVFQNPPNTL